MLLCLLLLLLLLCCRIVVEIFAHINCEHSASLMRSNYVALFKILTWIYAGANKDNIKHKEAKDNREIQREWATPHCLLTSVACAIVGPISSAARHFRHKIKFSILYSLLLLSCSSSAPTAPRGSGREAGQLSSAPAVDPTQIWPAVCLRVYKINLLAASAQCAPLVCGQGNSKRPDSTWNSKKKSRIFNFNSLATIK